MSTAAGPSVSSHRTTSAPSGSVSTSTSVTAIIPPTLTSLAVQEGGAICKCEAMSERIAVMGAGVMGAGIAQVMAIAGHDVVGYDVSGDVLTTAAEGVDTGRFGVRNAVERGKLSSEQ